MPGVTKGGRLRARPLVHYADATAFTVKGKVMAVVIAFRLQTLPGHYEQALDAYLPWVDELEDNVVDLQLTALGGDPASGTIHAAAVYEHAEVAEGLASLPFFAGLVDRLEPHLAAMPERLELDLVNLFAINTPLGTEGLDDAVLIEADWHIKLGHVDELLANYEPFVVTFLEQVPEARIVVESVHRASGLMRAAIVFDNAASAESGRTMELLSEFIGSVEHLLSAPPVRSELRLLHLFARG